MVLQLITEQASFTLPRNAEIEGKCGLTESEIHISWKNSAFILRIYFSKVGSGSIKSVFITKTLTAVARGGSRVCCVSTPGVAGVP